MVERADIVIAGGAVMGSSLAYWLMRLAEGLGLDVLVLERDPTYKGAASALSASSIRQQFSTPINIALSLSSLAFLRQAARELAVDGNAPEIGLRENGYLYLASAAGAETLRRNHAIQVQAGADIAMLDPRAVCARYPEIDGVGIACAALGLSGEGWFDGYGLMQAFARKAKALGARYRQGEVVACQARSGRLESVRLSSGETIACGAFVNCAGASGARALCRAMGFDIPVEARKRSVFHCKAPRELQGYPLVIDISGVWFRPEGDGIIAGAPSPPERDAEDFGYDVDWALFEEAIWPALAARAPLFERLRTQGAWAGHYDLNLCDANAIIGRAPCLENGYLAAGFSGHGIQQSPAIGRGLAELILRDRYETLDLSPFAYERIAQGRLIVERNVI